MAEARVVSTGRILRLWLPLEAAWLLMAAEGPFVTAVLARQADPVPNLAAFGVALAFGMLFESPIIMLLSASTALVEDRESYRALRRFTLVLNGAITLALGLFVIPPVFTLVTRTLMGLPEPVAELAHRACLLLLPWPAAIGFRRFYQGLLIRDGLSRRVAYGTALRLGSMGLTALLLAALTPWPGAWVGAAALSTGVVLEALASRVWVRDALHRVLARERRGEPLTRHAIAHFYLPLALTSLLTLGVNPMVSFFLGRARLPLESLAVMPVVNGLLFMFNTVGLSYQEVVITLVGRDRAARAAVGRFAAGLAALASGALVLMVASPLLGLWLRQVAGLAGDLVPLAGLAIGVLALQPAVMVALSYQRGLLVVARDTRPITWATGLEVAAIAAVLFLLTRVAGWTGAVAAAWGMFTGRAAAALFLVPRARQPEV